MEKAGFCRNLEAMLHGRGCMLSSILSEALCICFHHENMVVKGKICHAKVCSKGLQIGRCTERKAGELSSVLNCEVDVAMLLCG